MTGVPARKPTAARDERTAPTVLRRAGNARPVALASADRQRPGRGAERQLPGLVCILDAPCARSKKALLLGACGALAIHAAIILLARSSAPRPPRHDAAAATQTLDVELPPAPPALPPPAPPPPVPVAARVPVRAPAAPHTAPPPAAAQAAPVLEAPPIEDIPAVDSVVTGKGDSFAGGVTEKGGTSTQAVRDPGARAAGVVGGTGKDLLGDRSRAPRLADGMEWDCPFPPEADDAGMDHALVSLRVEVAADGRVVGVGVANDPGKGFGREARRCAAGKRWSPGLDRAGNATNTVALVNVQFDR